MLDPLTSFLFPGSGGPSAPEPCPLLGLWLSRRRRVPPPPGILVDVGGHRLHLDCRGEGRPTVVFDAALGASSVSWSRVQPAVAEFTRACTYDRAGFGWSEAGPLPRTIDRVASELHRLLQAASLPPPYLLVGHSLGGFTARLYAARYRSEVAGLVLVDPAVPEEWSPLTPEQERRLVTGAWLGRRAAWLARLGIARLVAFLVSRGAVPLARRLVVLLSSGTLRGEQDRLLHPVLRLGAEERALLRTFWTRPHFFEALASHIESVPESARQVAEVTDFGDLPVAVLTESGAGPEKLNWHRRLASYSTQGRHLVASSSGHWIPLDEPELVVETIRQMVDLLREELSGPRPSPPP